MKLVPKLALALFTGVFAVVASFTALRVQADIKTFDQDVRRDHRIVGLTAGAALAKTRTREDAIKLARRVDASRENIHVRFVSFAVNASVDLRPLVHLGPEALPPPSAWQQFVKPRDIGTEAADMVVTYIGAPVVDDAAGALELAQPLASRTEYIRKGVWSGLASSLAMLVAGGLTVVLIGARVVGLPVAQLIGATRGIAEGDFRALDAIRRRDEFGELADALRAMTREIEAERSRTRREADARIEALEQLRHAERLTTLGQLASVLAHEIGTPLNVIAGHGKLIATGRMATTAISESATAIGEQSDRITRIVRRILDYARRRPARRAWISVSDVVLQARAMLRALASQRLIELDVSGTDRALKLYADPDQLQQAVTNLLLNAIHASPANEKVSMTMTSETRATATGERAFVRLSISDRGEGVAEELRAKIFEPFFTTKAAGEGTGLGLSVVRDIAQEHGGFVEFTPGVERGSISSIYFPEGAPDVG